MNSFWVVVVGAVVITAAYNLYAKRIDRTVIQADRNKTTPARMYMDGADFVPTSRFVLYGVHDPTGADPRISRDAKGKPVNGRTYNAATGTIQVFPSYVLWAVFLLIFSYLGANLPIWRFAQPVNYIGFWVTALAIGLSAIGALIAPLTDPAVAKFKIDAFSSFVPTQVTGAFQPLWPMLFVTIACGAISGWHALFGAVGTARQIEYETDALPVGGGGMFTANTLALLSLDRKSTRLNS